MSADHFVLSDNDSIPKSGAFSHASTLGWGDWHVAMRLHLSNTKKADVTFGRGMPYVWIEPTGIDLKIPGVVKPDGTLLYEGATYGVHAPGGSLTPKGKFTRFSGPLLAISALGHEPTVASKFSKHASAVPRDTRFDWKYDQAKGRVETTWAIKTSNGEPALQGWIPHHYRKTTHDFNLVGTEYKTRRGKMIVAQGNQFSISWPFTGMIPIFPIPKDGNSSPKFCPI